MREKAEKPLVSIILPVYNAEKTLEKCVDSVLKQKFTDFELILVDDGSKDSSGLLCDKYASEDSRVRVIHKENSGVSDSRNAAMDVARGTYLQFLDSDDWLTPDATELFAAAATENDCDMVVADFFRVAGERVAHKGDIQEERLMNREEYAMCMMEKPADFYYGVLWNKFFRRDIIEKYHLRMDKEISWCEDFMFNLEYIRYIRSVYILCVPIYYYVKRKGSLVSQGSSLSKTIKMKREVFAVYKKFYKDVFEEEDYDKIRLQVYRFLFDAAGDGMVTPAVLSGAMKLYQGSVSSRAIAGDGVTFDLYREKKLLEQCLETVTARHKISVEEAMLLSYLSREVCVCSRKELADFIGIKKPAVAGMLQRLAKKGYLEFRELPETKETKEKKEPLFELQLLPVAGNLLEDIHEAEMRYQRIRQGGLSEEERTEYAALHKKIGHCIKEELYKEEMP
ncbi:MAG: glycosyltransferase [Lachnospiraceae bacterium]